jgi:hypothetical protein
VCGKNSSCSCAAISNKRSPAASDGAVVFKRRRLRRLVELPQASRRPP